MVADIKKWKKINEESGKKGSYLGRGFKHGRKQARDHYSKYEHGKENLDRLKQAGEKITNVPDDRIDRYDSTQKMGWRIGVAQELIEQGSKKEDLYSVFLGAQIYKKVGPGLGIKSFKGITKKLKKALEKDSNEGRNYYKKANELLKELEKINKFSLGLEKKVVASIFIFSIVAGMAFGLNNITGAAIGFSKAPSGFLGSVLFVFGILGLYLSKKISTPKSL